MSASAFRLDPNRCTGCQACSIACGTENHPGRFGAEVLRWRQVLAFNEARLPGLPTFALSLACHHCAEPACLPACPALAYSKDPVTGAVLVDGERCIGCRYCTWACPHDAPHFDEVSGTVEKCTFCNHRLVEGRAPACVVACPTGALGVEEVGASGLSAALAGFQPHGTAPSLRIVPLRGMEPRLEPAPGGGAFAPATPAVRHARITPREEWPLLAFTGAVTLLVGLTVAAGLGAFPLGGPRVTAVLVALLGGAALLVTLAHLGRPERAWRAVLGWRTSWLSREVLLVPAFLAASVAWLLSGAGGPPGLAVVLLGLASAFAVDRVYAVIEPVTGSPAPGRTPLVGPVLVGALWLAWVCADTALAALPFAAWKAWFALAVLARAARSPRARLLVTLRLSAGLLLPVALTLLPGGAAVLAALVLAFAGECVERFLFYDALTVTTPRIEMDALLARAGASRSVGR